MDAVKFMKKYLNIKIFWSKISISVQALIVSMVFGSVILLVSGNNPIDAYTAIFKASFSKSSYFYYTLGLMTPLVFTGLSFTLARKVGLIQLGAEGMLHMGAIAGVIIAAYTPLPEPLLIPFSFIAAIISGLIWGFIPAWLSNKFNSNVVISTLMLNYVAINFVGYMVQDHLLEEGSALLRTVKIPEASYLPLLAEKSILTISFIIAILVVLIVQWMLNKTTFGYDIQAVGQNIRAAETAGIKFKRVIVYVMMLSGAIAAIAGWGHILGVEHRLIVGFSPGYGFDGVSVAALAGGSPIGVLFASFIIAVLKTGSMYISRTTDVPMDFVDVIQAFVIIFVASPNLLKAINNLLKKIIMYPLKWLSRKTEGVE